MSGKIGAIEQNLGGFKPLSFPCQKKGSPLVLHLRICNIGIGTWILRGCARSLPGAATRLPDNASMLLDGNGWLNTFVASIRSVKLSRIVTLPTSGTTGRPKTGCATEPIRGFSSASMANTGRVIYRAWDSIEALSAASTGGQSETSHNDATVNRLETGMSCNFGQQSRASIPPGQGRNDHIGPIRNQTVRRHPQCVNPALELADDVLPVAAVISEENNLPAWSSCGHW